MLRKLLMLKRVLMIMMLLLFMLRRQSVCTEWWIGRGSGRRVEPGGGERGGR